LMPLIIWSSTYLLLPLLLLLLMRVVVVVEVVVVVVNAAMGVAGSRIRRSDDNKIVEVVIMGWSSLPLLSHVLFLCIVIRHRHDHGPCCCCGGGGQQTAGRWCAVFVLADNTDTG
jgi:hypothetical protein